MCSVMADMEVTLARVEKARQHFDAQRRWVADLEKVKEKKPAKHALAIEQLEAAEKVGRGAGQSKDCSPSPIPPPPPSPPDKSRLLPPPSPSLLASCTSDMCRDSFELVPALKRALVTIFASATTATVRPSLPPAA